MAYDGDGNVISSAKTSPAQTVTDSYDGAGRLTATTGPDGSTSYGYDPEGNLTSLVDPSGTTRYSYTNVNEVATVIDPTGATTNYTYTAGHDSWVSTISYPNRVSENISYDSSGRTTSMMVKNGGGTVLDNYAYTYNVGSADKTVRQTMTTPAGTVTYGYDQQNRLTSATGAGASYAYGYDHAGNRTTVTANGVTTNYTYNAQDQLTSGGASYDPLGNLTGTTGYNLAALSTNLAGQTTSISASGGAPVAETYEGTNQTHWLSSGNTSFHTDASIGITTATINGTAWNYTRAPNSTLISEHSGGATYYYLYDGSGNIVGLTNSAGQQVNSYSYDPWGNPAAGTATTVANPFTYRAGYQDSQIGLLHYGTRYYNPVLGTWTQLDPSGQNSGYAYSGDDPINYSDPIGTDLVSDVLGGASTALSIGAAVADATGIGAPVGAVLGGLSTAASAVNTGYSCAELSGGECGLAATTLGVDALTLGTGAALGQGGYELAASAVSANGAAFDSVSYLGSTFG